MAILDQFEFIDDAAEKLDKIIEQADKTRSKVEKKKLLREAQTLADAYQEHCEAGGNSVKQFKQFI
jgi:predicted translin family RNA/ssDNA-binding protein